MKGNRWSGYFWIFPILAFLILGLPSCSSVKHVPQGEYLLDNLDIDIEKDGDCGNEVTSSSLVNYLRQTPNHKVLGFAKLQLATYNLSGRDSTKSINKFLRKLGQAPVIYDNELTQRSKRQLELALNNRGYNEAVVEVEEEFKPEKKKMNLTYHVTPGCPQYVRSLEYEIPDSGIYHAIFDRPGRVTLTQGMIFDRNKLEAERVSMTETLRRQGYYAFVKDYITFIADTAAGSKDVDLTLVVKPPYTSTGQPGQPGDLHKKYMISHVYIITDGEDQDLLADTLNIHAVDSVDYKGITVLYGEDRYLRPSILEEKCFLVPGQIYNSNNVNRTYDALSQLAILKYINIMMRPVGEENGLGLLDAYIFLDKTRKQSVTLELEGTNSEGDLGFGVGATYQHRNLAHRGEVFTTKIRASYESLSGNLEGLINNNYTEVGAELGLTFPRFEFPFLSSQYKRRVRATSEVAVNFNFQRRPEYTRVIVGAGWKYQWSERQNRIRKTYDMLDISVVSLPKSTIDFLNTVINPLLRYSYEDHFIMRMGYTFYKTNRRNNFTTATSYGKAPLQRNIYTMRASVETAGNLLYAISNIIGQKKNDGVYKIFGIQYAQYIKGEFDYSRLINFDRRNGFAFRGFLGIGTPYGNSTMIPFEKRFYGGGANGVRGWGVRTLGPGRYDSRNSVTDFINQCGDISLILSAEYRFKLFWVFEGALFLDAGNIWTIRDYENQPGGLFQFKDFYKEIAASYGVGLRMDFTYFLLRLDLGVKAHNPAMNQEPWPLIHPSFRRDTTFHFSVGYPF